MGLLVLDALLEVIFFTATLGIRKIVIIVCSRKKSVLKQKSSIENVQFYYGDYKDLVIPAKSLIYCDPPYKGTEKYATSNHFNHEEFWQWCRDKVKEGHTVFVSEYNAPDDFECIKEVEITVNIDARVEVKKKVEKLFMLKEDTRGAGEK